MLKTEGNLNNEMGVPLTLFGLDAAHEAAVIEMGMSHPGEIARLAAIARPQIGVVTLAAPAHLEGLGTRGRGRRREGGALPRAPGGRRRRRERRRRADAEARAGAPAAGWSPSPPPRDAAATWSCSRSSRRATDGLRFVLGIGNREVPVHIPGLVGAHNAANAAAAAAAAIALGCTDREIVRGLAARPPGGPAPAPRDAPLRRAARRRLLQREPRLDGGGAPDASSTSPPPGAAPVAVLGDMLELGAFEAEAHRALGEEAAPRRRRVLAAFGPRARAVAEAARAAGREAFHTEELDALVAWARATVRPGDVLLVKGSRGMKLERLVEAIR